jgi:putative tryptophan/tyrosine transport system substrate-binding protein
MIPIVFVTVADPMRAGFVASLSRPGGNLNGFINFKISIAGG